MIEILCLALFGCALAARILSVQADVQADELSWVWRSIRFRAALLDANWSNTVYTGHPGVTTMALGALIAQVGAWLSPADTLPALDWLARLAWLQPDNAEAFARLGRFLTLDRAGAALLTSLGVVGIYLVGQRTLGRGAAGLAAALVALDPFSASLGGLMHVDGLLATFAALALLCLLAGLAGRRLYPWAAASGALAGLAVLTKSPALVLGPICGLVLLLGWLWTRPQHAFRHVFLAGLVWLGALALTLAAWPALWTNQARVWELITGTAGRHLERQTQQTGPMFYLLVLAFRSTPVTLLGALLGLAGLAWPGGAERVWPKRAAAVLALWIAAFLGLSTAWGTKYDRYAAPALVALALLAGIGWWYLLAAAWRKWAGPRWLGGGVIAGLIALHGGMGLAALPRPALYANPILGGNAAAVQSGLAQTSDPSLSLAAAYLDHLPEAGALRVATSSPARLAPLFRGQTLTLSDEALSVADWALVPKRKKTGCPTPGAEWRLERSFQSDGSNVTLLCASPYVPIQLDYLAGRVQPGDVILLDADAPLANRWTGDTPLHVLQDPGQPAALAERVAGALAGARRAWYVSYPAASPVTRAWMAQILSRAALTSSRQTVAGAVIHVYTLPASLDLADDLPSPLADFEDRLRLWGVGIASDPAAYPAARAVLRWQAHRRGREYSLELNLLDSEGHVRAAIARQLVSREPFTASAWEAGQLYESVFDIPLPPGLPPGEYRLSVGLVDPATEAHLGVWQAGEFIGTTSSSGAFGVAPSDAAAYLHKIEVQKLLNLTTADLRLLGLAALSEGGLAGDVLTCRLYWRARQAPVQDYALRWRLADPAGQTMQEQVVPLSTYPTSRWREGDLVDAWYDLALDPSLPAGEYTLQINVLGAAGQAAWEQDVRLGTLDVEQPDRAFALPAGIQHNLDVQVGESLRLKGYDLERSGQTWELTLYWQATARPAGNYAVFVNLLDAANRTRQQTDRLLMASGQVTSGWAIGQVAVDRYRLPVPAEAVRIGLGLYDADRGQRLTITLPDGSHPAGDRLILGE